MMYAARFRQVGVVPVVVLERSSDAVPTAKALLAGGVDVMEITMRTPAALDSIRAVRQDCPDMLVGAGTVCTAEQGALCAQAGASFLVSPGLDTALVRWSLSAGLDILPGCVTATELMAGMALGLELFKFFPADIFGGLRGMKALSGPFPGIRFLPTGGIREDNLAEYLSAPFIHAVGGSWLCTRADIAAGNFARITSLAAAARSIAAQR